MIRAPRTHVHLDHNRCPNRWRERWRRGEVFEEWPYGYQHAAAYLPLAYSVGHTESLPAALMRRGLIRVLGFDLVHAWRNRRGLARAEIIWTHTEREHLALGLLIRLGLLRPRPQILAQSVWLWDRWARLARWRRVFYQWLLSPLSLHTTLSRVNLATARQVVKGRVELVPYGTQRLAQLPPSVGRRVGDEVHVIAPGNDVDRDWHTLAAAAELDPGLVVTILSRRVDPARLPRLPNLRVKVANGPEELVAAYAAADVVAVPVVENQHASGITVALEALNAGRAVVVTRTGGLSDYLGDAVGYVEPGCASDLATALRRAAAAATPHRVGIAREHVVRAGLTDLDFARRHVLLTESLVSGGTPEADASAFAPVPLNRPS